MEAFVGEMGSYLNGAPAMAFVAAFLGGLLASLTPCVYPMIPITASYVGGSNLGGSKMRGFLLSVVYVTGIALTYAALGVFAAISGRFFGEINSNPYIFIVVGNIILVLGLSMLDLFSLPVFTPKASTGPRSAFGVLLVGIVSGFIAGPCTAPVLGVLLAFVASTSNIVFGGSLLFVFAFGMGALLIGVGTFSGFLATMPKSGMWMVKVKKGMGIMMIILAEYMFVKGGMLIF